MSKQLYLSKRNKKVGGVCGGIAEYFDIDPTIVRLFWVVFSLTGAGVIGYIIALIVIPEDPNNNYKMEAEYKEGYYETDRTERRDSNSNLIIGGIFILIGLLYMFRKIFPFYWINISHLWPLILVFIGVMLILKGRE
ncbi:PspC domain-containing protein [Serpentinicella sp. ANB-PHB4]|uniref:PspC domain-containing protein n=1 Tax=Serpentinicella sp. ANB-PHB4 TaxID=3074076 RepID=UPI0028630D18|nr:PspC domain-containing protein [Serpentinicella sp. ANB-PHB4]MDR5659606.1 PspC domain-containing protein [Serpentinicella sp. ANB-PHB4]